MFAWMCWCSWRFVSSQFLFSTLSINSFFFFLLLGFSCHCPNGWTLQNDLKTCKHDATTTHLHEEKHVVEDDEHEKDYDEKYNEVISIVECTTDDHEKCSPGTCILNGISHDQQKECECPSGFTAHKKQCVDIDECHDEKLNECSHDCDNTHGSYHCSCPKGFSMSENRKDCIDFNECSHDKDICGELQCHNTYGGFECLCENGEEKTEDGECKKISLCEENNGGCSQ